MEKYVNKLIIFLSLLIVVRCEQGEKVSEPIKIPYKEFTVPISNVGFACDDDEPVSVLELKAYLVEKYNIGFCIGMPPGDNYVYFGSPKKSIEAYPNIAKFVGNRFIVTDTLDIVYKIRQLCAITLTEMELGYHYKFTDSKCCTVSTIEGILFYNGDEIIEEILQINSKNIPC